MKKVMKTFAFGSKGFMRILLLCMIACFSLTQARADYYYKVKLQDKKTNAIKTFKVGGNANSEWSDWIFVSKGSDLQNALSKLVGETHKQEININGNLQFKYSATLGVTIHDVSNNEITLGYTDAGTTVENEDNCYKNRDHTFKIVGMAIGRGTNNGDILQFSDHAAFGRMKDDLIELDLAAWNKETFTGSYYMSNMSNLEKLILPDHNFAIGDTYTFAGAKKLKEIKYGNYGQDNNAATVTITDKCNVTCIGYAAFESCYNLPGSYIQAMVNSAAAYAQTHENDPGLEYDKIGDKAFCCCHAFTGDLNIPAGIKRIGSEAFAESNIKNLKCPAAITVIGEKAFRDNKSLETFTIGANIDKIDDKAFINDDKLQNLTSRYKIGTIGNNAFQACYGLNSVDINDVGTIGIEAFYMGSQKSALTTVSLGGQNIRIYSKAFRACGWLTNFGLKGEACIKQLNDGVFLGCRTFTTASVNTILNNYALNSDQYKQDEKYIPANLFFGVNGHYDYGTDEEKKVAHKNFTELTIPSQFAYIGKGAFGVSEKGYNYISSIKVSREKAPDCRSIDGTNSVVSRRDTFENVEPNHVTITFNDAAAGYSTDGSTGYMTYRNEPAFMRLLTKTLDEDKETYDVYPQMHAKVVLTRKFKEGWNTLALPFGAKAHNNDVKNAQIFVNALGTKDFAVYRGLRKNSQDESKSVFTFLKYASMDKPLNEFEPILVKMTAGNINADNKYTFENVDLNYDHDNNGKMYSAVDMDKFGCGNLIGETRWNFDGKYDTTMDRFKGNDYNTFYFDGTFKMFKDDKHNVLKEGDYIIQDGKFIKCRADKKYAMKGFRGYFKKFEKAAATKSEAINIAVYDGDGTVTDIVRVDANGEAEANAPHDIYNVMGQKVRSNALSTEGLKSGIYIINGKKVLVK